MKNLSIGIDIHGVIDRHRDTIGDLVRRWRSMGHRIVIITGESWDTAKKTVDGLGVVYDGHFSIVDHHKEIGTRMELRPNGWWMEGDEWDRSKGDFCHRDMIDIMFDDTARYARWMPRTTTFVLVGENFGEVAGVIADMAGRLPSKKVW